jgi:hypothetical protein
MGRTISTLSLHQHRLDRSRWPPNIYDGDKIEDESDVFIGYVILTSTKEMAMVSIITKRTEQN